jgi:hypothetical protein
LPIVPLNIARIVFWIRFVSAFALLGKPQTDSGIFGGSVRNSTLRDRIGYLDMPITRSSAPKEERSVVVKSSSDPCRQVLCGTNSIVSSVGKGSSAKIASFTSGN